jgi:hypothetical protein
MPQPIDFQSEVAKTSAAERVQQLLDRASLAAQQRLTQAEEQARLVAETQVGQTPDTENPELDGNGRRRNPFIARRRHGHGDIAEENREAAHHHGPLEEGTGRHLDVDV